MAEPTFIIAPDRKSITCLVCGAMSDDSQSARDYLLDTDEATASADSLADIGPA